MGRRKTRITNIDQTVNRQAEQIMAATLKQNDKKQLANWAGYTNGRLELIYDAQKHGCTPAIFHQYCDNKGPCLAVAFNTTGYAWGGFAPKGFNQSNAFAQDKDTFLFRLLQNHASAPKKYPNTGYGGVWQQSTFGPAFGVANYQEMLFMQGNPVLNGNNIDNTSGSVYHAYGGFTFAGDDASTICGNNYQLKNVLVYHIKELKLLPEDKPWRTFAYPWNKETLERLQREVAGYSPLECLAVPQVRVLLLGQVGSGKSSFFNTINSTFYGYVTGQAPTGSAAHSLTTRYRTYEVRRGRGGGALHFRLCDTMGLEEGYGIDVTEIPYLLDGHVPDRYQFNPTARISSDMHGFIQVPELQDKIHVATFVMDSSTVSVISDDILDKLRAVRTHVNQRGIPLVVLLTKIDRVCPDAEENLSNVFHSMQIRDKIDEVADKIGLPRSHILPVKNYESEVDLDVNVDILALLAMRQILRLADNFFDEQLDILVAQERTRKTAKRQIKNQ